MFTPSTFFLLDKKHFDDKYGTHKGLKNNQVISRVKNVRSQMSSNDVFRAIESATTSKIGNTED